jgi:hypothetical protein
MNLLEDNGHEGFGTTEHNVSEGDRGCLMHMLAKFGFEEVDDDAYEVLLSCEVNDLAIFSDAADASNVLSLISHNFSHVSEVFNEACGVLSTNCEVLSTNGNSTGCGSSLSGYVILKLHVGLVANVILVAYNFEEFVNGINRRSHVFDASFSTKLSCSIEKV